MSFEVITAVTMKGTSFGVSQCVFWLKFTSATEKLVAFFIMKDLYTEDGDCMFLCNCFKFLPNFLAFHSKRSVLLVVTFIVRNKLWHVCIF